MTILLGLPMLTFLLLYFILNSHIKRTIPNRVLRKKFKNQNEFIIALAFLFIPLFMLQNEVIFLKFSSVTYTELQIFGPLLFLKVAAFIFAGVHFENLFQNLKTFNRY